MSGVRLTFNLPGIAPAGKERPRVTKHGTFMPPAYKAWQELIRWQVRAQVPAAILGRLPLAGLLAWRSVYSAPLGTIRPDGDNADGALWDAIQVPKKGGWGLIRNDKQFKRWGGEVIVGPTAIHFMIEEL
jgi:Holliday junction resolvase RusA-like endonuclease